MKDLVAIGESLGWRDCETYIQSGNLVFEAASHPDKEEEFETLLSEAIEKQSGIQAPAMVYSAGEWDEVIAANPYLSEAAAQPKTVHALLIRNLPSEHAIEALKEMDFGPEHFEIGRRVIYLHLPDGMGRSKLGTSIERILKVPMTGRNWNTMLAVQAVARRTENLTSR